MSTRQSIYSREYVKEDHRMHLVLSFCFFMDSCLLVVIGKLLLYPGSVDSIYLMHGSDRHRLNPKTLMRELDMQLSCDNPRLDSQLGCKSLHIHGTRGAFFEVVSWPLGYTFVGTAVPIEFVEGSKHKEFVYSRLTPIQVIYVPVVLGSLDLRWPFPYDGIADMVHMLFMTYAGPTLASPT